MFDRRDRLIHDRTELVNQTRAFLAELGLIMPKEIQNFESLFKELTSEYWDEFNSKIQSVLTENFSEYTTLCKEIDSIDKQIETEAKGSDDCKRLKKVSGFGPLISVALYAAIGNGLLFKNEPHLSSYLGLVPGEYSSGGKQRLLGITKRGSQHLRTLLVLAANAFMTGLS